MDYNPQEAKEVFLKERAWARERRDIWLSRAPLDGEARRTAEQLRALREQIDAWYRAVDRANCLAYDIPRVKMQLYIARTVGSLGLADANDALLKKLESDLPVASKEVSAIEANLAEVLGDVP